MRTRITVILFAVGLALGVVWSWFWFRPELLFVNQTVSEQLPTAEFGKEVLLAGGDFHSVAHESQGTASIYRLADGKQVLRFTDFETSNGPALYVYLIAAEDAADSASVQRVEHIDLGKLKGNTGAQNYELPADVDLRKYRAVTIWCQRFSVNFATAPLGQIAE